MLKKSIRIAAVILAWSTTIVLHAQDLHFTDVQGMSQWYNASLKQDRQSNLIVNLRDVRYQASQAFQTGTALLNISTLKKPYRNSQEDHSYGMVTLGAAFDKSNTGLYKNNVLLAGYSYALKMSDNGLYMAAGFQGTITNYQLGGNGTYQDQFDQFGPIRGGASSDPLRFGKRYAYFSLNAGWSLFQNGKNTDWYVGLSARHVNRPFTEETKSNTWRLPVTTGMQAGVRLKTAYSLVDLFGMINLKANANEWIGGVRYTFVLGETNDEQVSKDKQKPMLLGFGCLYRVKDAFIPEIQLTSGKTVIGFHYDMNMGGIRGSGFTRRGVELLLAQKF